MVKGRNEMAIQVNTKRSLFCIFAVSGASSSCLFDWAIPEKKNMGGVEDMEFPRLLKKYSKWNLQQRGISRGIKKKS